MLLPATMLGATFRNTKLTSAHQAGVSDVGNNDKIIANTISGIGYDPNTIVGGTLDADESFTKSSEGPR